MTPPRRRLPTFSSPDSPRGTYTPIPGLGNTLGVTCLLPEKAYVPRAGTKLYGHNRIAPAIVPAPHVRWKDA